MKIHNIALIGCGQMGAAHLDDIYFKENVCITYVCDLDVQRAELFKRKYNAKSIITDYKECIAKDDVDIVICATYPSTHLDILKECIKHNKNLLCEKPITSDLESGKEFVRLVKENPQIKVLIGHILRHNTTYNMVRDMIFDGAIGSPIIMRMAQNHHTMNWQKYLGLIKETSPLVDCGVHYIDVMRWFTGAEIVSVSGVGLRTDEEVPKDKCNYALMTAKLSDGSVGYYEVGWANTMSSDNLKEFIGPKGRIKLVYRKDRQTHQEEGDLIEYYKYPEKTYQLINVDSKRKPTGKQLDCLIDMIENGADANPTIDEVWRSFEIAQEADAIIRGAV
ncbi:MAG: Gfo/Idh/MocA family oxidoreductase [Clostridia bacterium]|nr:Gfo/Idh/MocA family oxidoreductase [Clostridia bacterium]